MDIGASTGGFTDCLLQNGAARVIAVDTGYGQMDARLRSDPRVRLLEKTNARYLTPEQLWADPETREPVGLRRHGCFLHLCYTRPPGRGAMCSCEFCGKWFELVLLVKPQFEVGRGQVGKGGIVRDPAGAAGGGGPRWPTRWKNWAVSEIEVIESPDSRRGRKPRVPAARLLSSAASRQNRSVALHWIPVATSNA